MGTRLTLHNIFANKYFQPPSYPAYRGLYTRDDIRLTPAAAFFSGVARSDREQNN
jgi:hypothetical protein